MENKTGKYFKYAIGEIVLVVIGILIALQINTWNNSNQNTIKEKEYLNNLIKDIETQKNNVKNQIEHESNMRLYCEKALKYVNSDSLNTYLIGVTRKSFVINDPTFQDLKSSGNILLIKNIELRNKILSFYQFLEYSALVIKTSNNTAVAEFRSFVTSNNIVNVNYKDSLVVAGGVDASIKTIDVPWAKKIQEAQFKDKKFLLKLLNYIAQRGRVSSVHLDIMRRLEKQIENMKNDIEKYLKV